MKNLKVVNVGVDSLVIGFRIKEYKNPEAFKALEKRKEKAGEKLFNANNVGTAWFGKEFGISPRGAKGYEWVLENSDVRVCIAQQAQNGRVYPEVYVTFRAEYLWRVGFKQAVSEFRQWLDTWAVVSGDIVSRADLCADVQMDLPEIDLAKEVITRASGKAGFYNCEHHLSNKQNTGYRVGRGSLITRIYDKTIEIGKTHKSYFEDIWASNGWDSQSKVTRVEFQARRELLKEMSIASFEDLWSHLEDLWVYFTKKWFSIRVPGRDSHKNRWKVRLWWKVVQSAFKAFGSKGNLVRSHKFNYRYEHLMAQAKGVLVSAMAVCCAQFGNEHGCLKVQRDIEAMVRNTDFAQLVITRRARMAVMTEPEDNHLVNEAMRLGGKIDTIEFNLEKSNKP